MAASANPTGNQNESNGPSSLQGTGSGSAVAGAVAGNVGNGNSTLSSRDVSGAAKALKHNPGLSLEWSPEEQSILDDGLTKYASDSTVTRYVKIAKELQDKTVRDVVLRCRWMSKKESGKRRKEDHNQMKKSNKKGGSDPSKSSSHLVAQPSMPHPLPIPMLQMDNDDDIPYQEIGGATGKLLEQNTQFSNQISANLASFQIQDNINLLCQMRDNILTIMNETDDMPGIMSQMPPLPVKVNEELAKSILPRPPLKLQTS